MKKSILLHFLFCLTCYSITAQVTITETEKLGSLCKVYGFLKYYHPEVAGGKFNWNMEFIEMYPKIKKATSQEELSNLYLDWIEKLGKIKTCKKYIPITCPITLRLRYE